MITHYNTRLINMNKKLWDTDGTKTVEKARSNAYEGECSTNLIGSNSGPFGSHVTAEFGQFAFL